jgi:uncharacterized protein YciI
MKFKISLYAVERPHLADTLEIEACCGQHAIKQANADPRVESGVLYARDIKAVA